MGETYGINTHSSRIILGVTKRAAASVTPYATPPYPPRIYSTGGEGGNFFFISKKLRSTDYVNAKAIKAKPSAVRIKPV